MEEKKTWQERLRDMQLQGLESRLQSSKKSVEFWTAAEQRAREETSRYPQVQFEQANHRYIAVMKRHRKEAESEVAYWESEIEKLRLAE